MINKLIKTKGQKILYSWLAAGIAFLIAICVISGIAAPNKTTSNILFGLGIAAASILIMSWALSKKRKINISKEVVEVYLGKDAKYDENTKLKAKNTRIKYQIIFSISMTILYCVAAEIFAII